MICNASVYFNGQALRKVALSAGTSLKGSRPLPYVVILYSLKIIFTVNFPLNPIQFLNAKIFLKPSIISIVR